ncbi:MAG: hypothetical protein K9M98_11185 [Cephaloticoccus sp.]|nr:hypothetical protein [Cephaloticoccus sp.]MCF7761054.1 hypothetical protein [Cephaloticoccus sp.]
MDDKDTKENPSSDFNKLDLTQLQSFSFGTQWTQDKSAPADPRGQGDRPRREDRRDGPSAPRRDRRGFSKPAGGGSQPGGERREPGADRSAPQGSRPPRREFRSAPRGDARSEGYGAPQDRGPYDSPYFDVSFYPEDVSFAALAKTIRASYRTIELFEIARTVVGKNDRFIAVLTRKPGATDNSKQPLFISIPDGVPFESDEAVINHVMNNHLGLFFDTAEVEIDPPKGNFQVINKCGVTGELLGPPNYHRYNQIAQQHFETKVQRMSSEAFRGRIETVRDPEVVAQWLEKMKKVTRYTWKVAASGKPTKAAEASPEATSAVDESPAEVAEVAENATAPVASEATETGMETPVAETPTHEPVAEARAPETPVETLTFDSLEEARTHLLTHARDRVFKTVETARFHGRMIENLPPGEIRRAVEGAIERQRRFPLDTANGLRGRLRREHFTIFKKGSKGVSYVCAVKRKFRVPGQVFSDSLGGLISFIESHPMVKVSELAAKFLDIHQPAPVAPKEGETAPAVPELTVEQREKFARMQGDLRWLVMEGYVTEFIDGRLFAAPPIPESKKHAAENEENDPESYPDAPADTESSDQAGTIEHATPKSVPAAEVTSPEVPVEDAVNEEVPPIQPEAPAPIVEAAGSAESTPVQTGEESAPPAKTE